MQDKEQLQLLQQLMRAKVVLVLANHMGPSTQLVGYLVHYQIHFEILCLLYHHETIVPAKDRGAEDEVAPP